MTGWQATTLRFVVFDFAQNRPIKKSFSPAEYENDNNPSPRQASPDTPLRGRVEKLSSFRIMTVR